MHLIDRKQHFLRVILKETEIQKLLKRCINGDSKAQLRIYKTYSYSMYNTAFRILKDEQSAEDAMQEGFIKAFTKLESYRKDAPFEAWLRRIITNEALSIYRKNRSRYELELKPELTLNADQSTQDEIDFTFTVERVKKAMNALKDNYRIALNLFLLEGYSYDELSSYLQISYGNSRTLVSRAKQQLKNELIKL